MAFRDPTPDPRPQDRRMEARETSDAQVVLVTRSGEPLPGQLVDRSLSGLRVRTEAAERLQGEVTVLSPSTGASYMARIVWRTAPYVGLAVSRTVDMRNASGPGEARLRQLWREHIMR